MTTVESPILAETFPAAMIRARAKLRSRSRPERLWPPLIAGLMFAVASLAFATAAVLAPPVQLTPIPHPGVIQ
jgi:hypothetical protein